MDKIALVAGAGIGGLTAAIALRRAGWQPLVRNARSGSSRSAPGCR
ncbi:MAG TPA: hypothetical protein VJ914_10960 [Pseudonocardiaceae bacterium]|nr:hypothetical protein [Pseudonocardiaceae bacterium]